MGVALILKHHEDRLDGRVRIFFQPNEEGRPSGAPLMIRAGILNDLDAVYGVHVAPDLEVGQFGLIKGAATAASDRFDVHVRQQGSGHSARPHESVDTVWVASQIINAYYQLVGRLTDARNATVLTVCRMHGGGAHNVIPESVEFGGTLRSTHPEDRRRVRRQMHDTAERTASTYGAHADVDIEDGSPPVINDETLVDHVADTVRSLFGEQAVHSIPQASMGGEDFAEYLRHVPGVFVRVGTAAGPDTHFPLHHGRFDIDERPLAPTARLMATALQQHLARDLNLGKPAASAFALDR
jgi:amidohydrolase